VVTVESADDGEGSSRTMIRLAGEADVTTHALPEVLGAEAAKRPRLLLIEMSGLTFIDSSALSVILRTHRELDGTDCVLALVSPSATVTRVLQLVGADQVIPVYGSADEAADRRLGWVQTTDQFGAGFYVPRGF
jgi:anti-sigma B factor antagonist